MVRWPRSALKRHPDWSDICRRAGCVAIRQAQPVRPRNLIARPSMVSALLDLNFDGAHLAFGSGLVVGQEPEGKRWLISAWHNLTGRRSDNNVVMSETGAIPNEVVAYFSRFDRIDDRSDDDNAEFQFDWQKRLLPLFDEEGQALWFQHPVHGRQVDISAIPLPDSGADEQLFSYNPWEPGPPLAADVSARVSIIGYPYGHTGGRLFPIWVSGQVASEPVLDFEDLPQFLIDARTRPGQSGSPVVAYSSGGLTLLEDGSSAQYDRSVERLIGVYSGRIDDRTDLGRVWKVHTIRETIEGEALGPEFG